MDGYLRFSVTSLLSVLLIGACSQRPEFTVIAVASPATSNSAEPHLARGPDGTIVLSWQERIAGGAALRYSIMNRDAWNEPTTVAEGENWFVNWADFPSVTPVSSTLWAAHWLVKRPGGTYAYDVAIATSTDRGRTWSESITPHTDGTATEHGFASLFSWQDGVGALWLDGRNMTSDAHDDPSNHGAGGMTLRSAILTKDGRNTEPQLVDELVCDCCQTDVAPGKEGPIVVYRNRTTDEVRDIYVARVLDGVWQTGRPVATDGWTISGCPVNGPAIATRSQNVAVAWFTAANDSPRVRVAVSGDDGQTFKTPVDIDDVAPIGRVDIEWLNNDDTVVSWLRETDDGHGELCVRRVSSDGHAGPDQVIAKTTTARMSGFPQMILNGDQLVFAWTDVSAETPEIRTARLPVSALN